MGRIEINNFNIADLEQAIKNVLTETVIKTVKNQLRPINEIEISLFTRENTAKMLCISLPTLNEWTKWLLWSDRATYYGQTVPL